MSGQRHGNGHGRAGSGITGTAQAATGNVRQLMRLIRLLAGHGEAKAGRGGRQPGGTEPYPGTARPAEPGGALEFEGSLQAGSRERPHVLTADYAKALGLILDAASRGERVSYRTEDVRVIEGNAASPLAADDREAASDADVFRRHTGIQSRHRGSPRSRARGRRMS